MSKELTVHYDQVPIYKILFKDSFDELVVHIKNSCEKARKVCIVTDSNVSELYLEKLTQEIANHFEKVTSYSFPAGEENKNLEVIKKIYEHLILERFDRNDLLIALGGGVVGDMTGFAAATYLRGVDFIQIPTTLLSQVDSSIGGKTGVDFDAYKNMVGAFHQPKLVYMNLSLLDTLSQEQFSSGMSEIIKHGLIKEKDFFYWIIDHSEKIMEKDYATMKEMIRRSCNVKRIVVEEDPKEKGDRALLNFGHTIGHAVEKLADFKMLHGECVSIGLVAASYISFKRGFITQGHLTIIEKLLSEFQLPIRLKDFEFSKEAILETTKSDKKMDSGKIKFILLEKIGKAFVDKSLSEQEILEGIDYILEKK